MPDITINFNLGKFIENLQDNVTNRMKTKQAPSDRETSDMIADSLERFREKQVSDAYKNSYCNMDENKPMMNLLLGMFVTGKNSGLYMKVIADEIASMSNYVSDMRDSIKPLEWMLVKEMDISPVIVDSLERYAKQYRVSKPEKLVHNPKAMRRAVIYAYGSVENYSNNVDKNLGILHSHLDTLDGIDDETFTRLGKKIIDSLKLSEIEQFSPFGAIASWYVKAGTSTLLKTAAGSVDSYRDDFLALSRGFMEEYSDIRRDEIKSYKL